MEDHPYNFDLGLPDQRAHLSATRQYTVGDVLRKQARTRPGRPAVVGEDSDLTTYGELNDRVNALGNSLLERGIDHGTTLAILSENRPEFAEVLYAGAKLGALVPTMNWRQERTELLHCLSVADVDAVVLSETQARQYGWIHESDLDPLVVSMGDVDWGTDYEGLIAAGSTAEPEPARQPHHEDGVTVFYTSGTTGLPKGTVVSHRAMHYRTLTWKVVAGVGPDFVGWPPMFHMVTSEQLFGVGVEGGTFYPVDGFDAETVLDLVASSEPGYLPLMPGVFDPLLEAADRLDYGPADFDGLHYVGVMADLVSPETLQATTELFDAEYVNTFGSTEVGVPPLSGDTIPVGTRPTEADLSKVEGPLCDVKLVDEDWNAVAQGEYGELAVRGPILFSGYVGNREANESEFEDGWFRTGDMFVMNADGTYDFVDRRKYLIKSGGENIYPAEVERVLLDQPEIEEALVVRVPDESWGEVPMAYVALAGDASLSREDVLDRLEGEIARYKLPHYVAFVDKDDFPRSTTGKIVRGDVEAWEVDESQRVRSPNS